MAPKKNAAAAASVAEEIAKTSTNNTDFRGSTSASPAPVAPGGNRLRLLAPPPVMAIAIIVGLYFTIGIAAQLNRSVHPFVAKLADGAYANEYSKLALTWVEKNIADFIFFGHTAKIVGPLAAIAVLLHVLEPMVAVVFMFQARAKLRNGSSLIPLWTIAGYAVFILVWGVGSFSRLSKELKRLEKIQ